MAVKVKTNEISSSVKSVPADEFLKKLRDLEPLPELPLELLAAPDRGNGTI